MGDNYYKIDKAELKIQQESRAIQYIALIEEKCNFGPIQFLKLNFQNKKIRERNTEPDIKILIATMLTKILTLSGIKNEIDSLIAQDIIKMIFSTYGDLTLEEIYKAFELERYGSFDDKTEHFQLFNTDYIAKVLKKYKSWKHNMKIHHDITPNFNNGLAEISESQKEEILKNGVNRVYSEFMTTKIIEEPLEYIFDFLIEKGIIKNNNNPKLIEYYQSKLQQAKLQLEKEESVKFSENAIERKQIKIDLDEIVAGTSPKIIIRAKKIILTEFFNKQIELGQEKIF